MDDGDVKDGVAAVRRLVRERVVPLEEQIDETDEVPAGLIEAAAEMGLYGFAIPEEYGGLGLSMAQEARLVMELGYTTPAFRSRFGTNNGIAGHVLLEGGTPAQRKEYLPRLASGEWTASFALTEAKAGSDPSGLRTSARREDGGWVLDGSKRFITNAPVADLFMVFARHDQEEPAARDISVFLVPRDAPGLSVGPKDEKMGQHGALTAEVFLDGVRVPDEARDALEHHLRQAQCAAPQLSRAGLLAGGSCGGEDPAWRPKGRFGAVAMLTWRWVRCGRA
jgi:acyl-CoA dehydrogenase